MAEPSFAKISRGASVEDHNPYATVTSLSFRQGVQSPPKARPVFDARQTGYSSNIRPVVGYTQKHDTAAEYKEVCKPTEQYGRTTALTYRSPGTWDHSTKRAITNPTVRLPMSSGFVKEVPLTHNAVDRGRSFGTTTGEVFSAKPMVPQPTEPRRGNDWEYSTYKSDMEKMAGSVYHKERHGVDIITQHMAYGGMQGGSHKGPAGVSETRKVFIAPPVPERSLTELPPIMGTRRPFDRTGVSGENSFTYSTRSRPVFLVDRPQPTGQWRVDKHSAAGAAITSRMAQADPCEYLNATASAHAMTATLHGTKPTTRDVEIEEKISGVRHRVGHKEQSGYLNNTYGTALYAPEDDGGAARFESVYKAGHSAPSNFNEQTQQGRMGNILAVKQNAYVRGTFTRAYGPKRTGMEVLAETATDQVIASRMMKDPFLIDTAHAHKKRSQWV